MTVLANTGSTRTTVPHWSATVERASVAAEDESRWLLANGLQVNLIYDESQWLATERVTAMFGEGDNPDDALGDLFESLRELRRHLEDHEDSLATHLIAQLDYLRTP